MPDCFISYSSTDEGLARFVDANLRAQSLDVFLASVSLQPGERWSEVIWANLRASPWVVFLASQAALIYLVDLTSTCLDKSPFDHSRGQRNGAPL